MKGWAKNWFGISWFGIWAFCGLAADLGKWCSINDVALVGFEEACVRTFSRHFRLWRSDLSLSEPCHYALNRAGSGRRSGRGWQDT